MQFFKQSSSKVKLVLQKTNLVSGSVGSLRILMSVVPKKRRRAVLALRDLRGNTALHLTAINNHIDAAQFLVSIFFPTPVNSI